LHELRVNSNFSRWLSFLGSNNAERKFSWSTSVERKLALVKQREKKVGLVKQREKKVGLGALVHPAKLQSVNGVKTRARADLPFRLSLPPLHLRWLQASCFLPFIGILRCTFIFSIFIKVFYKAGGTFKKLSVMEVLLNRLN
jgi:hypothetical protein